jgi:oligopeptide transport system substrate-binding protein
MKRLAATFLIAALILSGCTGPAAPPPPAIVESGDYYTVYSGELTTINYLVTSTTVEAGAAANCVDGLVEYDNLGVLKPALAESWELSPDGLVWTFRIRQGVKWVTWEGKEYAEVTAQDWVDALKYIFDPANASRVANFAFGAIKNGEEYYNGEVTDFNEVGVKALDKYTLQYTLKAPIPYFLTMLTWVSFFPANGQFLSEVGEKFGTDNKNLLYCGPYIMTVFEPQTQRVFVKNESYWDKDKVYIKTLYYKYNKEAGVLAPDLFLNGEITDAGISSAIIADWMDDPQRKDLVSPAPTSWYSYFYAFNFDPRFEEEYEPENWRAVVNNANFRRSIFYALDRRAAMLTSEPYDPDRRLSNSLTPRMFTNVNGVDFTDVGPMAEIAERDSFNPEEALKYREIAKEELAGKATFPVKMPMPFNSSSSDWANRVQVVEQQMERLLGSDYIDIIPISYPPTNFLTASRRSGMYAIQECNGGPGFVDPDAYTGIFMPGNSHLWSSFELATEYLDDDGKNQYAKMIEEARAEVLDTQRRFELFAEAEAFLINEAVFIPYAVGGGGYQATKLMPFSQPWSLSLNGMLFKGARVLDHAVSTEEFNQIYEQWLVDRDAALKAAAGR